MTQNTYEKLFQWKYYPHFLLIMMITYGNPTIEQCEQISNQFGYDLRKFINKKVGYLLNLDFDFEKEHEIIATKFLDSEVESEIYEVMNREKLSMLTLLLLNIIEYFEPVSIDAGGFYRLINGEKKGDYLTLFQIEQYIENSKSRKDLIIAYEIIDMKHSWKVETNKSIKNIKKLQIPK